MMESKKAKGERKKGTQGPARLNSLPPAPRPLPFSFCLFTSRRAHTLTELLLVLTILGTLAVIALPRFASALMRSRVDAALDAARSDLHFTRARAVATGLRHQFMLDAVTREIVVEPLRPELLEGDPLGGQALPDVALRTRLSEEVRVAEWSVFPLGYDSGSGAANVPLVFYPEGRGDSAVLILEDGQGTRRGLRVDGFSGEIREMTDEEMR
jgi:type II secretory pathway pseudopilin PulG